MRRASRVVTAAITAVLACAGCATSPYAGSDHARVHVVTTTGILADLVANVGGDDVSVHSLVPEGGDPHSYEPSLRDVRNIVYADLAVSNYALLEEHDIIKTLDANVRPGVPNVSLAEGSVKYAAELIPLVENIALDTVWLGLRVRGSGRAQGADRSSDVLISAVDATGPGRLVGYLTGTFGDPEVYFDSGDGFDGGDGYADDTATLPPDAHTHMSWAFSRRGYYTLTLAARLVPSGNAKPVDLGRATFTFAVGVNPYRAPGVTNPTVVSAGHADLTTDLDTHAFTVRVDSHGGGDHAQRSSEPTATVVEVPDRARHTVPGDPKLRFLGRPGRTVYELPQAVLGAHVHGEIDPHLWQDVKNAQAYVKLIRDQLIAIDPDAAADYTANARRYLAELDRTDAYVRDTIARVPVADRNLITTHDAFGYLAAAYHLRVAGFVTPSPSSEPSLAQRRRLGDTIANLHVPAVFAEPNLRSRSSTLTELAGERGVRVCTLYGDSFDQHVTTYVQMMRANAESIHRCLT